MMRPHRWRRIGGRTAWVNRNGPVSRTSSSRGHCSKGKLSSGATCWTPALLTRMSMRSCDRSNPSTMARTSSGLLTSPPTHRPPRRGPDTLHNAGSRVRPQILDEDVRTGLGQLLGDSGADPAAGAGHNARCGPSSPRMAAGQERCQSRASRQTWDRRPTWSGWVSPWWRVLSQAESHGSEGKQGLGA